MSHILHPELLEKMPLQGQTLIDTLETRSDAFQLASHEAIQPEQSVSVVVRTLNEAAKLEAFYMDVASQKFTGEIELVVIDNESTDGTVDVARSYGATVRTITRGNFTHPKSLNMAIEAASHENVFVASGHILLATDQALRAGSMHLDRGASGAYAWPPLMNENASSVESLGIQALAYKLHKPFRVEKTLWGMLSMAGSMIRRSAWQHAGGFNEAFASGGEDSELARRLLANGESIVFDPVMAIHHTHGLSVKNRLRRTATLAKSMAGQGSEFDRGKMAKYRPDLLIND